MTRLLLAILASYLYSTPTLAKTSKALNDEKTLVTTVQQSRVTNAQTSNDRVSYTIGADLGENFIEQKIDINPDQLIKGLKDALSGNSKLSPSERTHILKNFQRSLAQKKKVEFETMRLKNKELGDAYLLANKNKPGVVTTPSGLQYKVVQSGKGSSPLDNSIVKVAYIGRFINGTIFEKPKEPVTFPVHNVIPGWQEILKLMKPGEIVDVVVPPYLAYGERGVDKAIGPDQTLLFTIHLIEVKGSP